MSRHYKVNLNTEGIRTLKRALESYKKTLPSKTQTFVNKLMDCGIHTAKGNLGYLKDLGYVGSLVHFEKQLSPTQNGCQAIIIMADTMPVVKYWLGVDGYGNEILKYSEVSPTLMYEFGSGQESVTFMADMLNAKVEVGKGTFPSDKNKPYGNINHADEKWGWLWKDVDGTWKRSRGIRPTQPMYNAWLEMENQITTIAQEVFSK